MRYRSKNNTLFTLKNSRETIPLCIRSTRPILFWPIIKTEDVDGSKPFITKHRKDKSESGIFGVYNYIEQALIFSNECFLKFTFKQKSWMKHWTDDSLYGNSIPGYKLKL